MEIPASTRYFRHAVDRSRSVIERAVTIATFTPTVPLYDLFLENFSGNIVPVSG